jgi:hypothetical protein
VLRELGRYVEDMCMCMSFMPMPTERIEDPPAGIGIDTPTTMSATTSSSDDTSATPPSPPTPGTDDSTDTVTDTAAPPPKPRNSSDTSAPISPSEETTPKLEPDTDADTDFVIPEIQGGDTSSSLGVTTSLAAIIVLAVCASLA